MKPKTSDPSKRKYVTITLLLLCVSLLSVAEQPKGPKSAVTIPDSCTSIMVGRLASVDGSTITSHTCDGPYRNWIEIVTGKSYSSTAKTTIQTGLHWTETPSDSKGINTTGEIPQAEKTFSFLNTSYPAMNEHQLAMGETTIMANRRLKSQQGIFQIEELQRIALQRCKTAREAIRLMGRLIEQYGYRDGAECLTIIDPKEVWQFEVFGPGLGNKGGIWAAARIPDHHVGVSANFPRIGKINLKKPDFFMASANIYSQAKKLKLWDGNKPFKVSEVYGSKRPGLKEMYFKYCRIREWWVLNSLAPSLKLDLHAEELPFSVKPDKKVSVREVMALFRATYVDSEYSTIKNIGKRDKKTGKIKTSSAIHPWINRRMINLLTDIDPKLINFHRMIAINRCSYSTVIQSRSWLPDEVGGITWLGLDNPAFSVRIPVFAGTQELIKEFGVSNQKRFRRDSAAWAYRRTVRLAQPRWDRNKKVINQLINEFEEKALAELPDLEKRMIRLLKENRNKALAYLTSYVNNFARAVLHRYWELGDSFWSLYSRGF
jgi:dipeptidase